MEEGGGGGGESSLKIERYKLIEVLERRKRGKLGPRKKGEKIRR